MHIGKQIQSHRQQLRLTQDELAERLYVSRQTISNWENGRHYPDIENLLLLSNLFDTSLDELVKGDVAVMQHKVYTDKTDRDVKWMFGLTAAGFIAIVPSMFLPRGGWVLLAPGFFFVAAFLVSCHIDYLNRKADVHTYKEIIAYMNGENVDQLRQQRNRRRDGWDKTKIVLAFTLSCAILALVAMVPYFIYRFIVQLS
ncbi:helix-turn-helix transcriptional regulator [Furfurilactobacillus milii]|nr:helix-turn-helix transcriptional regulator [Furfurilactobacillus milii]